MEKKILFICENEQGFLVRAFVKTLAESGYEVISSLPDSDSIKYLWHCQTLPDIFIVYLEGYENKYEELFPTLQQFLSEKGTHRYLYLVGNPTEINIAAKFLKKEQISAIFERPINTTEIINHLEMIFSGYSYDDENDGGVHIANMADSNKKSILVVDDDSTQLHAMQRWFLKEFNVYISTSGMSIISFLKKHHVDLILLDYAMPVLSGLEVFQILKSEPSTANIPVIFLTAKDDKETVVEVVSAKPTKYLLKTTPPSILVQEIKDFFNSRKEGDND
ncbi:MAG: response regulator [Treponema sp.]|nr:response regulator [Treponema sp.]